MLEIATPGTCFAFKSERDRKLDELTAMAAGEVDLGLRQPCLQHPVEFLIGVLKEHRDLIAAVLEHLARNRRGVRSDGDVLDQLDRNQALRPLVEMVRVTLL